MFVDDAADAFLRAGASDACNGEVFNVGGDQPITHRDLTTLLVDIAGSGRVEYVEWPKEKKAIDIGDFYADSTRFATTTGWTPTVKLADGLRRAVTFYRQHFNRYIDQPPRARGVRVTRPRIPCSAPAPREDAAAVRAAVERVLASGWYILGPEVEAFEAEFAAACGAASAIGVGNGTDAIAVILRALGIGPGDEVITSPLSAAYTALAIMMTGARPVFADVDSQRLTLDAAAVARAITPKHACDSSRASLRTGR